MLYTNMAETKKEANAFQKFVASILTEDQKKSIADAHTKFSDPATTAGVTEPEIKAEKVVKTKDGKTISIAGDPVVGVPVMDVTTGAPAVLVDGDYTLEDGMVITIVSGLISAVTSASGDAVIPADMAQMNAQFAAQKVAFEKTFSAKFAAQEKELTSLKTKFAEQAETLADIVKLNSVFADIFNKASVTPVEEVTAVKTKFNSEISFVEFKALAAHEKAAYKKEFGVPNK